MIKTKTGNDAKATEPTMKDVQEICDGWYLEIFDPCFLPGVLPLCLPASPNSDNGRSNLFLDLQTWMVNCSNEKVCSLLLNILSNWVLKKTKVYVASRAIEGKRDNERVVNSTKKGPEHSPCPLTQQP